MKITIRELLEAGKFKGIKILSGAYGLENEIKGVTIIEAPDIVRFIEGGEVLLTGLYAFNTCSVDEFRGYMNELARKKVSGIILKRGRLVAESEAKIELLMEYSEKCQTPVLEVPFEVSFRNIMVFIMEHLVSEEIMRLQYFKTTHDNFAALILSENHSEDGLDRILNVLEKIIGNPVAIFNQWMECLSATEDAEHRLEIMEDAKPFESAFYSNYKYLQQKNGEYTQYLVRIITNYHEKIYVVVTEKNQTFSMMDCIAVESAINALQFELARKYSIGEVERKFQNDIMHNLLNGKIHSSEELQKHTRLLGVAMDKAYRVVVFGVENTRKDNRHETEEFKNRIKETGILSEAVERCIKNAKFSNDFDLLALIQQVDESQTQKEYRTVIQETVDQVQKYVRQYDKHLKVKAGVGKVVEGIIHIKESYEEAKEAYIFSDIAGEISGDRESDIAMFSDLGIFRFLCHQKDASLLQEYIPEGLKKLYEYKKPQREDLIITLKTYLDKNQNLSRTAQALFVHYKTAAYRIEKIIQITGIDFDNANEVLSFRIGFIVYNIMKKAEKEEDLQLL